MTKFAWILLASCLAAAAAPHYFLTTFAGHISSSNSPIALNQGPVFFYVAYDPGGNLYYGNQTNIWRLNADGTDRLIAGSYSSSAKFVEGERAIDAPLTSIQDFKFDNAGNLFIVDTSVFSIYKVTPDGSIHTFAGNGQSGKLPPLVGPNIPATSVAFIPDILAIDSTGNVYTETGSNRTDNSGVYCAETISFPPDGSSSMLVSPGPTEDCTNLDSMAIAGSKLFIADARADFQVTLPGGANNPTALIAPRFQYLAAAPNGSIYGLSSQGLMQIDPATLETGPVSGGGSITNLGAIAVNPVTGDVAVAHGAVSVWTAANGKYQVVAGNAPLSSGDGGPATLAVLGPGPLAADAAGDVFFVDVNSNCIRKITPAGIVSTIAGTGVRGDSGDGASALEATLSLQTSGQLALDDAGNLYFINLPPSGFGSTGTIRKIDRSGTITTVAGGGASRNIVGMTATSVAINPQNLAVDSGGNLYFDNNGSQVFELNASGTISLAAGTGIPAEVAVGTPAASAGIGIVSAVGVDRSGFVYIGDKTHQVIWKIDANGNLQLVAGIQVLQNVLKNQLISSGPATSVDIFDPQNIVLDAQGNLYFYGANLGEPAQVLMVDTSGNLWTIGGAGTGGVGGDASLAALSVQSLAVDSAGNLYVSGSGLIREMSPYNPASPPPFLAQGGVVGAGGSLPAVAAVSPGGEVSIFGANFVSAANAHTVTNSDLVNGKVPTNLAGVCASFGGSPAAILGVYPGQLNVQADALTPGAVNVQVTANCGTPQAVTSNYSGVAVQTASPEFYSFKPDPVGGVNPIAAVNALTGAFIGPAGLLPGATFVAAKAGDIVQAYATGFGATAPSYGLGVIPGAAGTLINPYTLTLGGVPIPAANIEYAGISPCCAGFYQVDFTMPAGVPSGPQPLVINIAGEPSPPEAYIQIQ